MRTAYALYALLLASITAMASLCPDPLDPGCCLQKTADGRPLVFDRALNQCSWPGSSGAADINPSLVTPSSPSPTTNNNTPAPLPSPTMTTGDRNVVVIPSPAPTNNNTTRSGSVIPGRRIITIDGRNYTVVGNDAQSTIVGGGFALVALAVAFVWLA